MERRKSIRPTGKKSLSNDQIVNMVFATIQKALNSIIWEENEAKNRTNNKGNSHFQTSKAV